MDWVVVRRNHADSGVLEDYQGLGSAVVGNRFIVNELFAVDRLCENPFQIPVSLRGSLVLVELVGLDLILQELNSVRVFLFGRRDCQLDLYRGFLFIFVFHLFLLAPEPILSLSQVSVIDAELMRMITECIDDSIRIESLFGGSSPLNLMSQTGRFLFSLLNCIQLLHFLLISDEGRFLLSVMLLVIVLDGSDRWNAVFSVLYAESLLLGLLVAFQVLLFLVGLLKGDLVRGRLRLFGSLWVGLLAGWNNKAFLKYLYFCLLYVLLV